MNENRTLLWLDDYRDPFNKEKKWVMNYSPIGEVNVNVKWVKSYDEFTKWITDNGLPDAICFDHDLADEHYAPQSIEYKWSKTKKFKEKTGFDCAKWLIVYCMDNDLELPLFSSQSANPVGRENIIKLLTKFLLIKNK